MNARIALLLTLALPLAARAEFTGKVVKIGVLNDQSGLYADLAGQGSVTAARMAVEDSGGKIGDVPIEVVFADHQNKPDVGSNIARQWYDVDGVDAIVDVPTSSVALASTTGALPASCRSASRPMSASVPICCSGLPCSRASIRSPLFRLPD